MSKRKIHMAMVSSAELEALRQDKRRLDALESGCWDVRYNSSENGDSGDARVGVEIIGHFMGAPSERVLGEDYHENLRRAIDQAMTAAAHPPARPEYDHYGQPERVSP